MKVDTLINPEFEGLKEVPCPYGSAYINVKLLQERTKKKEQRHRSLENHDIIDILYSIPDIDIDYL